MSTPERLFNGISSVETADRSSIRSSQIIRLCRDDARMGSVASEAKRCREGFENEGSWSSLYGGSVAGEDRAVRNGCRSHADVCVAA
jgi:hypothetical protein